MSGRAPVRLLVNPAAGRGRALRRLDSARHALTRVGPFDMVTTEQAGDEARLALEAANDGVRALVVLGGDGTVSRVAAALVDAGATTPIAILGAGTGNDLAKSLGSPAFDYAAMAELVKTGISRPIDVGAADGRIFVNAFGVGFDVAVLERTTRARWLRGNSLYVVSALDQLFTYGGFRASDITDMAREADAVSATPINRAVTKERRHWLTIVVANGQWFGGAFRIAPEASLTDGMLDVVAIADASPLRRAMLFGGAPRGAHVHAPEVQYVRREHLTLDFDSPPWYQIDGELFRATRATIEVQTVKNALHVIA